MNKLIKKIKQFYKKEPKKFIALIFICILLLGFTLFGVVMSSRKVESIKSKASERESENRNERLEQRLDEQQNQPSHSLKGIDKYGNNHGLIEWIMDHFGGEKTDNANKNAGTPEIWGDDSK